MSVAAISPPEAKNSSSTTPLWMASLMGGVFVLASLAVIFYGVPKLWEATLASSIKATLGDLFNSALVILAQAAAAVFLVIFGGKLAGEPAVPGIRGGIFLVISTIFTVFFLSRAVGMIGQSLFGLANSVALIVFLVALGGIGFFALRYLRGQTFERQSHRIEDAGWLSGFAHKRSQGRHVRRLTMIALLVIVACGIQALVSNQHLLGLTDWEIVTPFLPFKVVLLPDAQFSIPLLLVVLGLWLSWRFVNYPPFADFLIATEAEMNKVSWTPRKALIRDTFVVLTTVFIITAFIFIVDIFWGWLLSRDLVGVLPRTTNYYFVELLEVPPEDDRQTEIAKILTDDRVGYTESAALELIKKAPVKWEEGKSEPVRIRMLQRRDVKVPGFDEAYSDVLLRRLEDYGAKAKRIPAKEELKNTW